MASTDLTSNGGQMKTSQYAGRITPSFIDMDDLDQDMVTYLYP